MNNKTVKSDHDETIYVNGRFLGRPVTGVERFAGMILKQIDALAESDSRLRWTVLAPAGVAKPSFLSNLPFRNVGRLQGHVWEQIDLWRAARSGTLINFCNSGPVLHGQQLTMIHDALVYRHPEYFSKPYGMLHRRLGKLLARRSELATVSAFSRSELSEILSVPIDEIEVIPNAVDHMADVQADLSVIDNFDLASRKFFLFVGSPAPNKNLLRTILAFRTFGRADYALVIVGRAAKSFASSRLGELPANVIATGRLSDEQIQALYQHAEALIFPSLYEGFGIPPLEAMRAGCLVLAADIPPVREVCGDAAVYFNPLDPEAIAQAMRKIANDSFDGSVMKQTSRRRTEEFSWHASALRLVTRAREIARRDNSTLHISTTA